ncbi:M23 family metallopeptidase [Homoserinibacter sp. GY 40078]|uniref:M23 family metallopeptidase n=1 Tax=Homoserinibacter sp. GY 40078 TaxID=2603275 RepID=UPI0016509B1A|nr:M23 family metallopeptidase [Homoserinibacter sp. GY 40078]
MSASDLDSLPPATTRRELRERERAAAAQAQAQAQAHPAPPSAPPLVPPLPAELPPTPAALAPPVSEPRPRSRAAQHRRRPLGARLLSAGALFVVGAFLVGVSLPANVLADSVVAAAADAPLAAKTTVPGQEVEVAEDVLTDASEVTRDSFDVKSWAQQLQEEYGSQGNYLYSVTNGGSVRWPFPYFVPISSGFGYRPAPCSGCSTEHNAIDLTPGAGAPIFAIASGVVIRREPHGGSWGNNLTIEHQIDGHVVTSSYAHMQWDSSPIELGQKVEVGDFLGLVGATGQATGAHLHLEIKVDGEYVDPYIWLKAHAG